MAKPGWSSHGRAASDDLGGAAHWETSNRQAREALLGLLARQTDGLAAARLVGGLVQLAPTAEDKRQAREALLGLLAGQTDGWVADTAGGRGGPARPDGGGQAPGPRGAARAAGRPDRRLRWPNELVGGVVQLAPTAEDKRQAREALLGLLARQTDGWAAEELVGGVVQLDPTAEDKRQAREALLGLLAAPDRRPVAAELGGRGGPARPDGGGQAPGPRGAARAAGPPDQRSVADELVGGVVQLAPTAEDKRQAREALLGLLAGQTDGSVADELVGGVVQLAPTAEDKRQAREALLGLLAGQTDGWAAATLVDGVVQLAPTAEDKRQAREALLGLLASQTDGSVAARLVGGVVQLDPTAEDKRQAREALLGLLAGQTDGSVAADAGGRGGPARPDGGGQAPGPRGAARAAGRPDRRLVAAGLVAGWSSSTRRRRTSARPARRCSGCWPARPTARWPKLAGGVVQLDPTAEDKRQAREALLGLLAGQTDGSVAAKLADGVVQLDPTAEDKRQAREALLGLLAGQTDGSAAEELVDGVVQLDPTAEDKRRAREALLGLLAVPDRRLGGRTAGGRGGPARPDGGGQAPGPRGAARAAGRPDRTARWLNELVGGVVQLDPTAEDKRQAREALLGLLADPTRRSLQVALRAEEAPHGAPVMREPGTAGDLVRWVAQLDPTVRDLSTWRDWAVPPTVELLAAVRRNSALAAGLQPSPR